jgi:copper(I)-binding protein
MLPMTDGLALPAGQIVWLGDNGTHAMFVQPDRHYAPGDELPAVLVFEKAGRVDVTFKVEARGPELTPGHGEHSH